MLASDVHIRSGTVVGSSVSIGQSTKVGYKSVLTNCSVGNFSTIHNGVCVGQDGFGFFVDENGHMVKKPQELFVRIANHVEIGANTCIDRGSWRDTVIGDHTKIDNLVQIGHNVVIGKCCMLCGQVGVAGSVTIGDYVTLGGRVAIRDHVTIASKVRLAANSSVTKDITEPGDYGGFPAVRIYILYSPFSSNAKTVSAFASHLLFRCLSASGVDNLLDCVAPASNLLSRASTR
ncbi:probable UDP-3-O-acylglucosamine N-acyltransferase 2, mitochondrial isoform X3 [Zingiber officinale]|nr:probable UDP-3-O-acylglucosamine N-acyltransferase 2, mitochondrial isoform X3 [Zingiber officinale]XP_042428381.1 probable UDP-3-O-acylglucosamine N-acyltransferase 2, mitochondrial isoform X3 [Zingiber officinale]